MSQGFQIADLHCDTASLLRDGRSLDHNDGMVSIEHMTAGGVCCQFFALFIHMAKQTSPQNGFERLLEMRGQLRKEIEQNGDHIGFAHNSREILELRGAGKIAAVLTVEEGGVMDGKLGRVAELYKLGVRLVTLTWNFENSLGFPNSIDPDVMGRGLKPFGKDVVELMNETGMIVDVSHLSDGGFWDVVKISKKPFIASHSNARALCGHPRNLTDDMLSAVGKAGGVVALNFYHRFLGTDETGSLAQIVAHAQYVKNVAGIEAVALGSDFDGFSGPCEMKNCADFPILTAALEKAGFTGGEIEKICWDNAMRVIKDVL